MQVLGGKNESSIRQEMLKMHIYARFKVVTG